MIRRLRFTRQHLCVALAAGLLAGPGLGAAQAGNDGEGTLLGSLLGIVGLQSDTVEAPSIEYRERAPLVLPRGNNLREPAPTAAERTAAWPQDPDVLKARRAAEAARTPRRMEDMNRKLTKEELMAGRVAAVDQTGRVSNPATCELAPGVPCNPTEFWASLNNRKSEDSADTTTLMPGVEPSRDYLTQPPKGYRTPTKVVKYTFEPKKQYNPQDAQQYIIDEANRKRNQE